MLGEIFEARGNKYVFEKITNLWGDNEIALLENGEIIGYLNKNFRVNEAIERIKFDDRFIRDGVIE
ncbi:hypothetical protein RM616_09395 [Mammaliicoccus sciuri]|uniref:hypothetical protein n=1 Tax=Mammaliicoccus sciuri TaxID=1296 RepID=UPI001AAEA755|nr:hypothetical protein [Mammaliicoccus sciuri]MBO3081190.1 hypothetical protein [Mammaliicoccus sciuri]MCJ0941402.1 hypothetical protein [Mammaliicoccus sciuri]MDT0669789.1 hypothetical protein [Mammaliicoccus sciuri]